MNKTENDKKIAETVRLYVVEELSIKRIAERLNISRQAVLYRLKNAGVKLRPRRHESTATVSRAELVRLYEGEGLSVEAVARSLKIAASTVARDMVRFSIERRPRNIENRKPTPLDSLKIDESTLILGKILNLYPFTEWLRSARSKSGSNALIRIMS